MTNRIVYPRQQIFYLGYFVTGSRNTVQVEISAHPYQIAVVGVHICECRQRVDRCSIVIPRWFSEYISEVAYLTQTLHRLLKTFVVPHVIQIGIFLGMGIIVITVLNSFLKGIDRRFFPFHHGFATSHIVICVDKTPRTLFQDRIWHRFTSFEELSICFQYQLMILPIFLNDRSHTPAKIDLHTIGIPIGFRSHTTETEWQKRYP